MNERLPCAWMMIYSNSLMRTVYMYRCTDKDEFSSCKYFIDTFCCVCLCLESLLL